MIELYINSEKVILPADFSMTFNEENPKFTKRGEYSFDITLSLENKINSRIFKHINRRNNITLMKEADALFLVDERRFYGMAVDIENSDVDVSFQFVSGNSEVNFESTEKKIWQLDWGSETEITYAQALDSITAPSYLKKYVCAPVKFTNTVSNSPLYGNTTHDFYDIENIIMNPYLLYYVNKLAELFGYVVSENDLNDDDLAKIMYLPNRVSSLNYADALPDLSVSEFIQHIEELFNVSFNFSSRNRTLSILKFDINLSLKKRVSLMVEDSYNRDKDDSSNVFSFKKLKYNLAGSGVDNFIKLPEDVVTMSELVDVASMTYLKASLSTADKNKFKIYRVATTGRKYIFGDIPEQNYYRQYVSGTGGYLYEVERFGDYERDGDEFDSEFELSIRPASIAPYSFIRNIGSGEEHYTTQIPYINQELYIPEEQSIIDAIQTSTKMIPRSDKIEIALYNGLYQCLGYYNTFDGIAKGTRYLNFPISFVDTEPVYWLPVVYHDANLDSNFNSDLNQHFRPVCNVSFSTKSIYQLYHSIVNLDTSKIYIFKCIGKGLTSNDILVHDGAEYIPVSIEKTTDLHGFSKQWTGKFYKVISLSGQSS